MEPALDELIPTRATLLHRLKDWQDHSSWQDFFDTYRKLIYGVAVKAGLHPTEAEEVVQETMISVAKQMPTFNYDQSIGSFKGWLLNLTRWRITDQLRKRPPLAAAPKSNNSDDPATEVCAPEPLPDTVCSSFAALWDAEWEQHVLAAAITKVKRQLDPQKFQIFDFYVNKQWPPEKVATTFGINLNQVYLAKHRVTEMIAEEVKKLGLIPS